MSDLIEDKKMLKTLTKEEIWQMFIKGHDKQNKYRQRIRALENQVKNLEIENNKLERWLREARKQ